MLPNSGNQPLPAKPPLPPAPLGPIDLRACKRSRTMAMPPVGYRQPHGKMSYATLRDLSCCGVGIARGGQLDLPVGTALQLFIHLPGQEERYCLWTEVCWCHYGGSNTYLGLRFAEPLEPTHPILAALLPDQ
jgi:hypothetical protein